MRRNRVVVLASLAITFAAPVVCAAQVRVQFTYVQPQYRFATSDSSQSQSQDGSLLGVAMEARKGWFGGSFGVRGGALKGETGTAPSTGAPAAQLSRFGRANRRPVSDTTVLVKGNYFELPIAFRFGPSFAHVSAGPTVKLHSNCDITVYRDFATAFAKDCPSAGPGAIEWVRWNMEYSAGMSVTLKFVSVGLDAQWSGSQLELQNGAFTSQQLKPVGRATGLLKIGIGG